MNTGDSIDSGFQLNQLDSKEICREFLRAVSLAQAGEVQRLAQVMDWSLLKPEDDILGRVMNRSLWQKVGLNDFVQRNRNQVAEAVVEAYDFTGYQIENFGGWSVGTDDGSSGGGRPFWSKSAFAYPEGCFEDALGNEEISTTKLLINLTFERHTWIINEVLVCDASGAEVGSHGDLHLVQRQNSVGLQFAQMPGFLDRIIGFCRDSGRADLLSCQKPSHQVAKPGIPGPSHSGKSSALDYSDELLYRLVEEGLMETAFESLDWSVDPYLLVDVPFGDTKKKTRLIDAMEFDLGEPPVHMLRACLAKLDAGKALRIIDEAKVNTAGITSPNLTRRTGP